MALIEVDWRPPRRQLRQFALLFVLFAGVLGTLSWLGDRPAWVAPAFFALGGAVGVLGLVAPAAVRPVWIAMMALALPIGFVVSTVLMVVIFFLILTPIGLAMRLAGYDPMRRGEDAAARDTFWIERPPAVDVRRYFRQY